MEKSIHEKSKLRKTGGTVSEEVDIKTRNIFWDKQGSFLVIKGSIHPRDLAVVNVYVPNNKASTHLNKNMQRKRQFFIVAKHRDISFSVIGGITRQKIRMQKIR